VDRLAHEALPRLQGQGAEERRLQPHDVQGKLRTSFAVFWYSVFNSVCWGVAVQLPCCQLPWCCVDADVGSVDVAQSLGE
jgi:hypothetical protein